MGFKLRYIILPICFSDWVFAQSVQRKADLFFNWLKQNENNFNQCEIQQNKDVIKLCDNTQVSFKELQSFFLLSKIEIIDELKKKNIQVEMICESEKSDEKNKEALACVTESSNKTFKKVSSLHGLFVPDENKIIIRQSASVGTLIHEYLHSLQSKNNEKIHGHIYKSEKNNLRREIETELDEMMIQIKELEQKKDKNKLSEKVAQFMKLNDYMLAFSKWQDLIDERSLFLLFLKYEKEFHISEQDIQIVKKNLKFICDRKDLNLKCTF